MAPPIEQLIEPHLDGLRRWCRRRCRDAHEADDVVQDVVLQTLLKRDRIRNPDAIGTFLYRCAERRLVDLYRKRVDVRESLDDRPAPAVEEPEFPSERRLRLRAAVRMLPSTLRQPVRMHYFQGHTLREVATRLDTTVVCIKLRLYRARRRLREGAACE